MIIGISGNNGSGKDTFGMLLQAEFERHGKQVKRTSFARALYFVCAYLYGIENKAFYDACPKRKEDIVFGDMTVRKLLNSVGSHMREVHQDTWVKVVKDESRLADITIVTDVRFQNESAICDKLYLVTRDNCEENVGTCYGEIIENNGTLDDLALVAKKEVESWIA